MKCVIPCCCVLSVSDESALLNVKLKDMLSAPLRRIFLIHLFPHHAFKSFKRLIFCPLLEYKAKLGYLFAFFGARVLFLLNDLVNAAGQLELNQLLCRQHLKSLPAEFIRTELVLAVQNLMRLYLVQWIWTFAVLTDYLIPMKHLEYQF